VATLNWDKIIPRSADKDLLQASRVAVPTLTRDLRHYRPGGLLVAALERLVQLCRSNDIEPILVGVPVTSTFRECVQPDMEVRYRAFLADFCQAHDCLFVDYYAALPDALFLDYHHANVHGTDLLSYRLTTEVLAPLLRGQPPAVDPNGAGVSR
jgi:hypothetical protein